MVLQPIYCNSAAENTYLQARQLTAVKSPKEYTMPTEPDALPAVENEPLFSEEPSDESLRFLMDMDLHALRLINADVLGWIHIPNTPISYPLLQADDNLTYLNKTWDGSDNSAGSIFLECESNPNFSDFNTLIYGHRMKNGSMFGSLGNYSQQGYLEEHPYIYITTDDSILKYEIFSAYEAPVVSDTYRLYIDDKESKQSALEYFITSSVLKSAQVPTIADSILTLSTCTGTGTYHSRWVVQAVLTDRWRR